MLHRLECFFPRSETPNKSYIAYDEKDIRIGDDFVFTIREFEVLDLEISAVKKIKGSIFNPIYVRAIFDVKSKDLIPFFIKEHDVHNLQVLIGRSLLQARLNNPV